MPKPTARTEEDAADGDGYVAGGGEGGCTSKKTYTRRVGEWAGMTLEVWTPVRDELAARDYAARLNHVRDTLAASGGEVAA